MSDLFNRHSEAMDLAEEAFILRTRGDTDRAQMLFRQALNMEMECAYAFAQDKNSEPTRSILFRSAAALAYHAGELETAETLIGYGLAGDVPSEIRDELRGLFEDVSLARHLRSKGKELDPTEIRLTLIGKEVGFGIGLAEPIIVRVEWLRKLMYRTAERLMDKPYRTSGDFPNEVKTNFSLYLKAFTPGSFNVLMYVGHPYTYRQSSLLPPEQNEGIRPSMEPGDVAKELVECLKRFQLKDTPALQQRIPDEHYYTNFVGLARQIAPDGEQVTSVILRYGGDTEANVVKLDAQARQPILGDVPVEVAPMAPDVVESLTLIGELRAAKSPGPGETARFGRVILYERTSSSQNTPHLIHVPVALMKDVVQPYYEEIVEVVVRKDGKKQILEDIGSPRQEILDPAVGPLASA